MAPSVLGWTLCAEVNFRLGSKKKIPSNVPLLSTSLRPVPSCWSISHGLRPKWEDFLFLCKMLRDCLTPARVILSCLQVFVYIYTQNLWGISGSDQVFWHQFHCLCVIPVSMLLHGMNHRWPRKLLREAVHGESDPRHMRCEQTTWWWTYEANTNS